MTDVDEVREQVVRWLKNIISEGETWGFASTDARACLRLLDASERELTVLRLLTADLKCSFGPCFRRRHDRMGARYCYMCGAPGTTDTGDGGCDFCERSPEAAASEIAREAT